MDLSRLVDALIPGPDGRYDRVSAASHATVTAVARSRAGRPVWGLLHGNRWMGHPFHPVVVTVPVGAWVVTSWYDLRSVRTGDARDEATADGALRVGVAGAALAAATGLAQYVDTRGAVRRETTAHAALNTVALGLVLASWAARRSGARPLGRRLSAVAVGLVGVSGYLGGDISYRHGVGVRPQALRTHDREAAGTSDAPLEASGAHHS